MTRLSILGIVLSAIVLGIGCARDAAQYTSQDLDLLPCETGASPTFFQPLEFGDDGKPAYGQEQIDRILNQVTPETKEVVVFVHGWNKNPRLAESDFSNFLCRMHGYIRQVAQERNMWLESEKGKRLLVVGVFWPSTWLPNSRDPFWLKPPSYFRMRARADLIASGGLPEFLMSLSARMPPKGNLHLVGHSFGGRMLIHSLRHLSNVDPPQLPSLLKRVGALNVVLLNGALPAEDFGWLLQNIQATQSGRLAPRISLASDAGLYNVHSFQDSANRILFPLASAFGTDEAGCAAGACGVQDLSTVCVDPLGRLPAAATASRQASATDKLAAWNIDATPIVFDHGDIYKGRVARLVVDLLFRSDRDTLAKVAMGTGRPTRERCRP